MPPAVQGPVEVNIGGTVFTTLRPTLADASPFFKELLDETDGPRAVGVEKTTRLFGSTDASRVALRRL